MHFPVFDTLHAPARLASGEKADRSEHLPRRPTTWSWVPVRALGERHRERIVTHLLGLTPADRYLRFGCAVGDEQVRRYAEQIDLERDAVLGIFNRRLQLIAMAHLACEKTPQRQDRPSVAEFGVSVTASARGRGYGGRLFQHAVMHARNRGIDSLFIHALSENTVMLKIARRAGATVERDGSESEAWLKLPKDSLASHLEQIFEARAAEADYRLKRHLVRFWKWLMWIDEVREHVAAHGHISES